MQVKGEDDDSDLAAHGTDRKQICADMAGSFQVRYSTALSDPRLAAFRVFEHRKWPAHEAGTGHGGSQLYMYGIRDISYLIDNYSTFFEAARIPGPGMIAAAGPDPVQVPPEQFD